jgi:AP-1 complex subunit gamma-1
VFINRLSNLTRELLDYLAVCDSEFKPDLTAKIATLIQRFAPDKRWHIDSLLQVRVARQLDT